jgi:sialic acid synthase SpsE
MSLGLATRVDFYRNEEFTSLWTRYLIDVGYTIGFLKCAFKYPSTYTDYKIGNREYYANSRGLDDAYYGISDHTPGIETALCAAAHGALVIEKHITLDKSGSGPDHACSITPTELGELRKYGDYVAKAYNFQYE